MSLFSHIQKSDFLTTRLIISFFFVHVYRYATTFLSKELSISHTAYKTVSIQNGHQLVIAEMLFVVMFKEQNIFSYFCAGPSDRASDSGARGRGFNPQSGRHVVSLSKIHLPPKKVLVIPRKRWLCPDMTEKLLTGT